MYSTNTWTVLFDSSRLRLIFAVFWFLSVICKQCLKQCYYSVANQRLWPDSEQILRHQYGIFVAESQTFLLAKRPQRRGARRNGFFLRLCSFLCYGFPKRLLMPWNLYSKHVKTSSPPWDSLCTDVPSSIFSEGRGASVHWLPWYWWVREVAMSIL